MALTADLVWVGSITFVDRDLNPSTVTLYAPAALTYAQAQTMLDEVRGAMETLSDAVPSAWSLSKGAKDLALVVGSAPETSDVERKGVFQWRAANGALLKLEVPSIKNTYVIDGSNVIDPADADVTAFKDLMVNTTVGAGNSPVTYLGSDLIGSYGTAYKRHRASSKG